MAGFIRRLPFISGLFHTSTPYHTGTVTENKLGFQVFRFIGKNLEYALRPKPAVSSDPAKLKTFERDGILQIENFLSPEDWANVRREYDNVKDQLVFKAYKPSDQYSMRVARVFLNDTPDKFPDTLRILGDNKLLHDLAGITIRRNTASLKPVLTYLILEKDSNTSFDDDIENILHADVHYPTVKAFFYLSPVSRHNGAYVYAKGSHKISWERLKFEYNHSVRVTKLRRGDKDIDPKYLDKRGDALRNIITPEEKKAMGIQEEYYTGDANTILISNNRGFHRRGEFDANQKRELILINYRNSDAGWLRKKINRNKENRAD